MQPCTPSAHHATRYSLSCLTMLCTVAIVALISDMVGEGISPMAVPSACIVVPPSVAFVKLNPPKTSAFDWRCKERLQAVLSSHLVNTVCEVQVLRPYKDSHSFIPLHTVYCSVYCDKACRRRRRRFTEFSFSPYQTASNPSASASGPIQISKARIEIFQYCTHR